MIKRVFVLLVCMTVCGAALFAQTTSEADFEIEIKPAGGGVVITGYKGKGGDVVIPATIGGKAVVGIGEGAFYGCASLAAVTIPDSVTTIGEEAFANCGSLEAVTVSAANRHYQDIDGVLFTTDGKTLHTYPAGRRQAAYTIPDGVTTIGRTVFLRLQKPCLRHDTGGCDRH